MSHAALTQPPSSTNRLQLGGEQSLFGTLTCISIAAFATGVLSGFVVESLVFFRLFRNQRKGNTS